jgi:hypothetical protein
VDFSKLSREDLMVLVGGIVLIIGMFAFPWYSIGLGVYGSLDRTAIESPYSIWGILALIVEIVIVLDIGLARFSPATQLPTLAVGRDMTRVYACALLIVLLFIKFIAHVGSFGWGFFVDVILAIVVTVGAWFIAQGKATPVSAATRA